MKFLSNFQNLFRNDSLYVYRKTKSIILCPHRLTYFWSRYFLIILDQFYVFFLSFQYIMYCYKWYECGLLFNRVDKGPKWQTHLFKVKIALLGVGKSKIRQKIGVFDQSFSFPINFHHLNACILMIWFITNLNTLADTQQCLKISPNQFKLNL